MLVYHVSPQVDSGGGKNVCHSCHSFSSLPRAEHKANACALTISA